MEESREIIRRITDLEGPDNSVPPILSYGPPCMLMWRPFRVMFYTRFSADSMVHVSRTLSTQENSKILQDIADALEAKEQEIMTENEVDVESSQQAGYDNSLISCLAMKLGKIRHCSLIIDCSMKIIFTARAHTYFGNIAETNYRFQVLRAQSMFLLT